MGCSAIAWSGVREQILACQDPSWFTISGEPLFLLSEKSRYGVVMDNAERQIACDMARIRCPGVMDLH